MSTHIMDDISARRLISFDGAGPRATSQLLILRDIMRKLQHARGEGDKPILPCEYFHLMGGSDTGGLIVAMLTKLRMSVDEAIEEFDKISKQVYFDTGITPEIRSGRLRSCLESLLVKKDISLDAKMYDGSGKDSCQSFLVARPKAKLSSIIKIRSYDTRNEPPLDITIVDAILATCATPPAFSPVRIRFGLTNQDLIGGGLGTNNPTREVLGEAQLLFGGDINVASLVSIGARYSSPVTKSDDGYVEALHGILSDCEEMAKGLDMQIGSLGFYFRFSIEHDLELDSRLDLHDLTSHTANYLQEPMTSAKIDQCVVVLESQLGLTTLDQIVGSLVTRKTSKGLPPLTMHFVMRQVPWSMLEKGLIEPTSSPEEQRIVVISGMGGCGKTQLTVKFVKVYKSMYDFVWWVDASSEATAKADLISHVRSLGGEHSQKDWEGALEFLSKDNKQGWLIIYDNADDIGTDITNLIPSCEHGAALITTRNRGLGQLASQVHLELDVMTEEEAVETMLRSAKLAVSDNNRQMYSAVAEELGWLPVALVQAGSYMFQTKCSPQDYSALLQNNRASLLELPAAAQRDPQHRSAYAAFDISYRRLPPHVRKFLHLLSFYHHAEFPLAVIRHAAIGGFKTTRFSFSETEPLFLDAVALLNEIFCPSGIWDDNTLHKVLMVLQNYSLVTCAPRLTTMALNMHPLVHSFCLDRLPVADHALYRTAAIRLSGCWEGGTQGDLDAQSAILNWGLVRHMRSMLPYIHEVSINDRATIAMTMAQDGTTKEAEQIWEALIEELCSLHGRTSLQVADAHDYLARATIYNYPKSICAVAECARIREELLGPCHVDTLDVRMRLAKGRGALGEHREAERILKKLQVELPEASEFNLELRTILARLYTMQGHYAKAEVIQQEQLRFMKQKHGDAHLRTMTAMENLADSYRYLAKYAKAEELLLTIRAFHEKISEGDVKLLIQKGMLACVYSDQGRYDEAEAIYSHAVDWVEREKSGKEEGSMLFLLYTTLPYRAETFYQVGRYTEAEQDCVRAITGWKDTQGPNHPGILRPTSTLARVYHALGRYSEAETIQLDMVDRRTKFHNGLHPSVIDAYADLAATHVSQGRLDEAENRQVWVLEQRKEWLGDMHPATAMIIYDLARTYEAQGRIGEARDLLMQAEAIQQESLGKQHPHYRKTSSLLEKLQHANPTLSGLPSVIFMMLVGLIGILLKVQFDS